VRGCTSSGNTWRERSGRRPQRSTTASTPVLPSLASASRSWPENQRGDQGVQRAKGGIRSAQTYGRPGPGRIARGSPVRHVGTRQVRPREVAAAHGRPWLRLLSVRAYGGGPRRTCRLATPGERGGRRPRRSTTASTPLFPENQQAASACRPGPPLARLLRSSSRRRERNMRRTRRSARTSPSSSSLVPVI
jgi:hypothetical protein